MDDDEKEAKSKQKDPEHQKKAKAKKELKIRHLEDEIENLKSQLKTTNLTDLLRAPAVKILKAEIRNLEVSIINQKSLQTRLEDKYNMLQKSHKNACHVLQKSHNEVMDSEELEFMAETIENKKNELLTSRNFIVEMQKVGWSNLPPKVADECKKTHLELNYINFTTRKYKEETEEIMKELNMNIEELYKIQTIYNENKIINNQLESEVDEIITELESLHQLIHSKKREAEDLQTAVNNIEGEIDKAMKETEMFDKKHQEEEELIRNKRREERHARNKEIEDLQNKQIKLQQEFQSKEVELKKHQEFQKQSRDLASEKSKHSLPELTSEYQLLLEEIEMLKHEIIKETKLKMEYFNILEDMLGKLKIICRCRDGSDSNILKVKDENNITVPNNKTVFVFDHYFGPTADNTSIFEAVNYLYDMANTGFNCYIVTMGGKKSGKSHITIGPKENGLVFLGLNKIKEIIKSNRKQDLKTRIFAASVEMTDHEIYDLVAGKLNQSIDIKMDAFKMTVLSNAKYDECTNDEDVRQVLKNAIQNRSKAATSLKSSNTTFVFIVTLEVYNKFQHRFLKGKVAHVKLGSFDNMKSLNEELFEMIKGNNMDYKRSKINQLLQDCFGGVSKTSIIGTVDPSKNTVRETEATLTLVSNLKKIVNDIGKNSEPEKIYSLKNDIERLLRGLKAENLY